MLKLFNTIRFCLASDEAGAASLRQVAQPPNATGQAGMELLPNPGSTFLNRVPLKFFYLFFVFWAIFFMANYRDCLLWDNARQLYTILTTGDSMIPSHRYTRYLLECLAIIAVRSDLSVNAVAISYLLGYCFYYLLITLILLHYLKRRDLAFGLIIFVIAGMTHGVIYPWEAGNSAALLFLLVGFLEKDNKFSWGVTPLACLLCPILSFYLHPSGMVVIPFAIGLVWLARRGKVWINPMIALAGIFSAVVIAKFLFSDYEHQKSSMAKDIMSITVLLRNVKYFIPNHIPIVLAVGAIVFSAIRKKKKLLASYILIYLAGYTYLSTMIYQPGMVPWIYSWHGIGPTYAIAIIPLVDCRLTGIHLKSRWLPISFLALVTVIAGYGIIHDLEYMRERRYAIQNILATRSDLNHNNFWMDEIGTVDSFVPRSGGVPDRLLMKYGIESESILQSAFDEPTTSKKLGIDGYSRTGNAVALNTRAASETIRDQVKSSVTIFYPLKSCRRFFGMECFPVTIINNAAGPLASRDMAGIPVMITYQWLLNGQMIGQGAFPLKVDVPHKYTQNIYLERKDIPDSAELVVSLSLNDVTLKVQRSVVAGLVGNWKQLTAPPKDAISNKSTAYLTSTFDQLAYSFNAGCVTPQYTVRPQVNPIPRHRRPVLFVSAPLPSYNDIYYINNQDFYLTGGIMLDSPMELVVKVDGVAVSVRYTPRSDLSAAPHLFTTGMVVKAPKELLINGKEMVFYLGGNKIKSFRMHAAKE